MNINQIKSAKHVNMAILKQKMIYVFIVGQNNMEALHVMNADMKKMKKEKKQIILFVKIVIQLIIIISIIIKIKQILKVLSLQL